jgi:hypothetical protein
MNELYDLQCPSQFTKRLNTRGGRNVENQNVKRSERRKSEHQKSERRKSNLKGKLLTF